MRYKYVKHDDDALKDILYRLRNIRGLDPAMRSPESLERFIKTHKILERGDEWMVLDGESTRVVATNHGQRVFESREFLEERILEYERVLRETKEALSMYNSNYWE